jgi:sigma-B regulation protein RsbU (phosphoserine phosphatase)
MTAQADPEPAEDRLRDIQSLTDVALSGLNDHELLAELLGRVKDILLADTVAVLLLDFSSAQLIVTAAAGLEKGEQAVRIPVGRGFAGRIAADNKPVILDRVDHTAALNPILRKGGIQSLMGVPLAAGGRVIGVLHAGSLTPGRFTGQDIELLQVAAERAATAVQSIMTREDRLAAAALQRSLLPSALPVIDGVEIAARYIPGRGEVGGDWYDVFTLPGGELGVVMGDVAGCGLPAAVIMGRIRSALRAYALDSADPSEVLDRLDAKMQHFEPGALATVLYAVIDPGLDRMRVCLAGHFPPVFACPGHPAEPADVAPGLMIGIAPDERRQTSTVEIPPGTLMCFYTDGLIERPGQPVDDGLARLCQAVAAQPPDSACAAVIAALVAEETARDDIALLMVWRHPSGQRRRERAAMHNPDR